MGVWTTLRVAHLPGTTVRSSPLRFRWRWRWTRRDYDRRSHLPSACRGPCL